MKALKLPGPVGAKAAKVPGFELLVHSHPNGREWLCSGATWSALEKSKVFKGTSEWCDLEDELWVDATNRFVTGVTALLAEPLPEATREEAILYLYGRPTQRVEYMGRGGLDDRHLPGRREDLFTLDVAERGRRYLFRHVRGSPENDDRYKRMGEHWHQWKSWANDPESRLVLSFGGGGFRLFGCTTALKVFDRVLEQRSQVAEVWGSSGGALLAYVYAMGFEPETLEELGYDLYHGRHKHLTTGSVGTLLTAAVKGMATRLSGGKPKAEMAGWLDVLEQKQPAAKRRTTRVPFYALATNPARKGIAALGAAEHIPPYCKDFLFACDPRDAVAASTAVPLILSPLEGITGDEGEWVDGSISDENPITLPYIKWIRDRANFPDTTPKRLKIVLLSLNLRSSEFELLHQVQKLPVIRRVGTIRRMARLFDLALDSKDDAIIRAVTESANVEVYAVKLNLGKLHLRDPRDIPAAIRAGASLESWVFTTYRKFG